MVRRRSRASTATSTRRLLFFAILTVVTLDIPDPAAAQTRQPPRRPAPSAQPRRPARPKWRWERFLSASAGYQAAESDLQDNVTFIGYAREQGNFDVTYRTPAGPLFDVNGGIRLWRDFGVAAGVSAYRKSAAANVSARIPHPFFFNQLREASADTGSLRREELAIHVQALWMLPVRSNIDLALFAGPSYFQVRQPFVESLRFNDVYPYDTTEITGVNTSNEQKRQLGFNAGVDVTYMLTKSVGVGALVRYSRAQVEFTSTNDERRKIDAGGAQAAAGVRFRF